MVDTYCLQSIVTDADRAHLFAAVRARLEPGGFRVLWQGGPLGGDVVCART